ncbi:MAG: DUF402 domain-containing protein [Chloroflexi bacterium]|uniref:DUF402 domain-containing protein n=1 Tax=Candidatus Chlorohelix allophototropha TaxID=3003348 RepID=A0A8T7M5C5_9CHLR|nr:DUF402 domain-containing protein [Chloroflexota bacterium]WJW69244.1 DUF402 domain-containing protein [Chloroflexota bacterium L227-S17]
MNNLLRIESFIYPDIDRYFYPAQLLEDTADLLLSYTPSGAPFWNGKKQRLEHYENHNLTLLFPKKDFNIIIAWRANWDFHHYYINIALPPERDGSLCRYVDLDLDVMLLTANSDRVLKGDRTAGMFVLDREEFEERKQELIYPTEIIERAEKALEEVLYNIKHRIFPFDDSLLNWRPAAAIPNFKGLLDHKGLWLTKVKEGNV